MCDQNHETNSEVLFSDSDGEIVCHLKKNGISYQLNKTDNKRNSIAIFQLQNKQIKSVIKSDDEFRNNKQNTP